ncbi:STAS domain-containing protein [Micromonospora sp. CPCC 206061]|uniref:STAS domain-containing protein n=1 Tax=Micromonospora sp. CPCC 206061 TaxID=3122410 RepID=UPI002FF077AB
MSGPQERPPPVFAIGPVVDRADIPRLCARLAALVRDTGAAAVLCDVGAVSAPDAVTIEALARLRLTARRLGCDLRVLRAHRRLAQLVALTGLTDVLPAAD